MYKYIFYRSKQGKEEIKEYLQELLAKAPTSKTHRIEANKIGKWFFMLEAYGTRAGEPHMKHLDGDLWELRPTDNRIIYAYWKYNTFILLHHFKKRTQKTPQKEIDQAKRNLKDWLERSGQ